MTEIPRLHLISSRYYCPLDRFPEAAAAAATGGVDVIHVREPDLPEQDLLDLVQRTRAALRGSDCRLLVNTSVDVALAAGADGVHLPEQGPLPDDVRSFLPQGSLVGVSAHSVESVVQAEQNCADYIIAGHVFETGSKPGQPGRGLDFIERGARAVRVPVVAIGGITPENTHDVVRSGAHGIAVISGILDAEDPGEAAARFRAALERGKGDQE